MAVVPGLESLLKDEIAVGVESNHHILVARVYLDQKATHVICVKPAEGVYFDENLMGWLVQWSRRLAGERWGQRRTWLGLGRLDILALLGQMSQNGFVGIWA